jgi:DNA-binding response OmpR family regulator
MKQHVLVVDDEAPIRDLLTNYLERFGYQVTAVATGAEAMQLAGSANIVVLDIALLDCDGMEVLAALRLAHPELPVIMLTGMGFDSELVRKAQQQGAAGYLTKGLPLQELLLEVRHALSRRPLKPA